MLKNNKVVLLFALLLLSITSCTKFASTEIGIGELIPAIDGVTVKDTTLDVIISTYADESKPAYWLETSNVLGKYSDPDFGNTHADIYVQMQPLAYPFSFAVPKDSIKTIDSVVLVVQTPGYIYGDSTKNLGFRVFKVNDPAFIYDANALHTVDKSFTVGSEITHNNQEQKISPLSVKDTTKNVFLDSTGIGQLRIKLNSSFAQELINSDANNFKNDTLFRQAFPGIKISTTSGHALLPINLGATRIAIYYKYISRKDGSDDTTVAYLRPAVRSAAANHITTDHSGSTLSTLPLGNLTNGSQYVYLQAQPGVFARLKIPGLETMKDKFIYRAELLFNEPAQNILSNFVPNLFVAGVDESNRRTLLKDVLYSGSSTYGSTELYTSNISVFGAAPLTRTDSLSNRKYHQYNFKLTSHVQDVAKGITPNYTLDIFAPVKDSVYSTALNKYVQVKGANNSGYVDLNYPVIHRTKLYGNLADERHKARLRIVYAPVQ